MQSVSDIRSNESDQFVYAARKLGKSELKKKIFNAVYSGKQRIKTVDDIVRATGLSRKAVLNAAKKLVTDHLIQQEKGKHNNDTAYTKDEAYKGSWQRILKTAGNKIKIDKIKTKVNPGGRASTNVIIKVAKQLVKTQQITIDDISSFEKVKKVKKIKNDVAKIPEAKMKLGILKILKENGPTPKDWGGEKNDIYTTKLKIGAKRFYSAFALKGPGKKNKKLTVKDMGKNGDQIQRLQTSSTQVILVQYWQEIDQNVVDLMQQLAIAKSYAEGRKIYFGIIDGDDSARLIQAYPNAFK